MTSSGPPPDPPGWQPPPPAGPPPSYPPPPYGQPGYSYGYPTPPPGPAPDNYLVAAILTTLFCCLPFGIVSIVFAAQVNSKWAMGDWHGAMDSSKKAKNWAFASFACGAVMVALWIIVLAAGSRTGSTTYNSP